MKPCLGPCEDQIGFPDRLAFPLSSDNGGALPYRKQAPRRAARRPGLPEGVGVSTDRVSWSGAIHAESACAAFRRA
ncbi:hypothetical protein QP572_05035 [Brevibacterium sp. UMB10442]|nr:hypothetical protein [Brevibacterium sp. UMB10442]